MSCQDQALSPSATPLTLRSPSVHFWIMSLNTRISLPSTLLLCSVKLLSFVRMNNLMQPQTNRPALPGLSTLDPMHLRCIAAITEKTNELHIPEESRKPGRMKKACEKSFNNAKAAYCIEERITGKECLEEGRGKRCSLHCSKKHLQRCRFIQVNKLATDLSSAIAYTMILPNVSADKADMLFSTHPAGTTEKKCKQEGYMPLECLIGKFLLQEFVDVLEKVICSLILTPFCMSNIQPALTGLERCNIIIHNANRQLLGQHVHCSSNYKSAHEQSSA